MNNKINKIFNRKKFNLNDFKIIDNYFSQQISKTGQSFVSKKIKIKKQLYNAASVCYSKRNEIKKKIELIFKKNELKKKYLLLLHGSFSTGLITNFSDIDLIFFVDFSNYKFSDYKKLHKLVYNLNKFIYNYDPLAHHGIELFNINIFENYDETILPVNTLEKATVLNTNECIELRININVNQTKKNSIIKFNEQVNNFLNLKKQYYNYSPYKLKSMISVFFLICVLRIQAKENKFIYKKESLEYIINNNIFDVKVIDYVSKIRDNWTNQFTSKLIRLIFNLALPIIPSLLIGQKVNIIIYNPLIYFKNKKIFNKLYDCIKIYEKN